MKIKFQTQSSGKLGVMKRESIKDFEPELARSFLRSGQAIALPEPLPPEDVSEMELFEMKKSIKPFFDYYKHDRKNIVYLITTYNRPVSLRKLLEKIGNSIVYVWNDGSKEDYSFINDFDNVIYFENPRNLGKTKYWLTVTNLWQQIRLLHSDYFCMLPDDMMICDNFEEKAITLFESIDDNSKIAVNLYTDKSRYMKQCWTEFQPIEFENYLLTNWLDMAFIAKRKFFEVQNFFVCNPGRDYSKTPELGSGVGASVSRRLFYVSGKKKPAYMSRRGI